MRNPTQGFLGKVSQRAQDAYARAGAIASETFSTMRIVAAFGGAWSGDCRARNGSLQLTDTAVGCARATVPAGERNESRRYRMHLAEAQKNGILKGLAAGLTLGAFFFLLFVMFGVGLWFGVYLIVQSLEHCGPVWKKNPLEYCKHVNGMA